MATSRSEGLDLGAYETVSADEVAAQTRFGAAIAEVSGMLDQVFNLVGPPTPDNVAAYLRAMHDQPLNGMRIMGPDGVSEPLMTRFAEGERSEQ